MFSSLYVIYASTKGNKRVGTIMIYPIATWTNLIYSLQSIWGHNWWSALGGYRKRSKNSDTDTELVSSDEDLSPGHS